ncbi:MAG TPA: GtrA family protein [Chthoniobacteraceae bacterium]|jgi:putative flippase GtrA|nr:GtrA family protein [Chthoniobacteraceae bacterium]
MESQAVNRSQPAQPKQPLVSRLGFFVLGGVGSTLINSSLLELAKDRWAWPYAAGYAFSTASTAVIFFLWSYFVNFRTSRVWRNCLGRYLCCVIAAQLLNYLIGLCGLRQFGSTHLMRILVIGVVQSFTGGIKFLLYHFWVFPHAEQPRGAEAATVS